MDELRAIYAACVAACPENPLSALSPWRLVGPFELLHQAALDAAAGRSTPTPVFASDTAKWTRFRFRYDPPELQTVAVKVAAASSRGGSDTAAGSVTVDAHLCYHRDDPKDLPGFVALGRGEHNGNTFAIEGSSLAAILAAYAPSSGAAAATLEKAYGKPDKIKMIAKRAKQSLASTCHGLDMCVPYDRRTELGYRDPLIDTPDFVKMLHGLNEGTIRRSALDEFDNQLRMADIANDECDFGLSLELGLNCFAHVVRANDVFGQCIRMMDMAYMLLNRDLYRHILKCHGIALCGLTLIRHDDSAASFSKASSDASAAAAAM